MDLYHAGNYLGALKEFIMQMEQNKDDMKFIDKTMHFVCQIYDMGIVNYTHDFIEWIEKQVDNNNSFAQAMVAYLFEPEDGFKETQRELLMKSASVGNVVAECCLGLMHQRNSNMGVAMELYALAASKGYSYGHNGVGNVHYSKGAHSLALHHYKLGAQMGNPYALRNLGEMYEFGTVSEGKNYNTAIEYYKQSIDQGCYKSVVNFKRVFRIINGQNINESMSDEMCVRYFEHNILKAKIKKLEDELWVVHSNKREEEEEKEKMIGTSEAENGSSIMDDEDDVLSITI